MKIVVDSSVLIKAYKEFSAPHQEFLNYIRFLNKKSRKCLVYLCVNAEVLQDYEQSLRGQDFPPHLEEAFLTWYTGIVNYSWQTGGSLDEAERKLLDCNHPVEHALIAFACENDKRIVATRDINSIDQTRCFFSKAEVIRYLIRKGVSVIDVGEATKWIDDKVIFSLEEIEDVDITKLSREMERAFNNEELKALCFYLSVDYDYFSVGGKQSTIINIVSFFNRVGRLNHLLEYVRQERPLVHW